MAAAWHQQLPMARCFARGPRTTPAPHPRPLRPRMRCCSFMRIRLDRVIEVSLPGMTAAQVGTSTQDVPKFPPPQNWTAPYVPYAWGWWNRFML